MMKALLHRFSQSLGIVEGRVNPQDLANLLNFSLFLKVDNTIIFAFHH